MKEQELQVLQAVKDANMPVGAIQLSRELGIPSANIGRALWVLEKQGLLEKVQNKGRYITQAGELLLDSTRQKHEKISIAKELIDAATDIQLSDLLDILTVRRLLEPYAASCCALQLAEDQKQELESLQMDYKYQIRHGAGGSTQDLTLHLKIAEYGGNAVIVKILQLILTDRNYYAEFTKAAKKLNDLSQTEHDQILEAIFRGDGNGAAAAMESHLDHVIRNVRESFLEHSSPSGPALRTTGKGEPG